MQQLGPDRIQVKSKLEQGSEFYFYIFDDIQEQIRKNTKLQKSTNEEKEEINVNTLEKFSDQFFGKYNQLGHHARTSQNWDIGRS